MARSLAIESHPGGAREPQRGTLRNPREKVTMPGVSSGPAGLLTAPAQKRRRVRERQESYVMTAPGGADRHRHCATVDSNGNGQTAAAADGHSHQVVDLVVQIAGGHSHDMSAQRCSAGHERGRCLR